MATDRWGRVHMSVSVKSLILSQEIPLHTGPARTRAASVGRCKILHCIGRWSSFMICWILSMHVWFRCKVQYVVYARALLENRDFGLFLKSQKTVVHIPMF